MKRLQKLWLISLIMVCSATGVAGSDFLVRDADAIEDAMKLAQPGDTLTLANGIWTDQEIRIEGNGTAENPILIRAQTPGRVVLNGESTLGMAGKYLIVSGLRFVGGDSDRDVIQFRVSDRKANYCRLTETAIIDYNPENKNNGYKWVSLYGTNNRVDHCYFKGKTNEGALLVIWADAQPDTHRIDSNYFGFREPFGANGAEIIRIGTSDWSMFDSRTVVENNYFEHCNGEIEIISNKTGENVFRYNTFYKCEGMLTLRHGNRAWVEGNFFFGGGLTQAGGVRVIGEDHTVINNYFVGLYGTGLRSALPIMNGVPNSPLNRYFQVKNPVIAFNTFVDCKSTIVFGAGRDSERSLPPLNVTMANNAVLTDFPVISQEDAPDTVNWIGNIFQGSSLGIDLPASGVTLADPKLAIMNDSLWRPLGDSPLLGAAEGDFDYVREDMDGQPRGDSKDIGADQSSDVPALRFPLTPDSGVGPAWLGDQLPSSISVRIVGEGDVALDPPGSFYENGTEVTLTATSADRNWTFAGWTGDVTSSDNPITIVVDQDKQVTATFTAPPKFKIAPWISGKGKVVFSPSESEYWQGTTVEVLAVADPGWKFEKWGGALSGNQNPDTLVMDSQKSLLVTFAEDAQVGNSSREISADVDLLQAIEQAATDEIDSLILTTSGGVYTTTDSATVNILRPLTIMAAPGLAEKPILTNSDQTGESLDILRVYDHLTVKGVIFDGGHEQTHGMKYGIRLAEDNANNLVVRTGVDVTIEDCDFRNFFQGKDPDADGHGVRYGLGVFGGTLRIENCTFMDMGYEAIRISDTEKYDTPRALDKMIIRNCTFVNIDAECIRFYSDLELATKDADVLVEHLTIVNSATRVAFLKNNSNSIFRNIIIANSRQSGHGRDDDILDVQLTGSRVSHIDTFQVKKVAIEAGKGGTVDASTIYGFDPMFADVANRDFTLADDSPAYGKAHDGSALGDLRWAKKSTAVEASVWTGVPESPELLANYPNPFNPDTRISFTVLEPGHVSLQVYDSRGREVTSIQDGLLSPGKYSSRWQPQGAHSGVYFLVLKQGSRTAVHKMLLLK